MNINNYIILEGFIEPIKFMNLLCDKIENSKDFEYEPQIFVSTKNLQFRVYFGEEEKFCRKCIIDIELFQDKNNACLLKFLRRRGELSDYEKNFSIISDIIKNLKN